VLFSVGRWVSNARARAPGSSFRRLRDARLARAA